MTLDGEHSMIRPSILDRVCAGAYFATGSGNVIKLGSEFGNHLFEQFHPFSGRAAGVGWELGPRYALLDGPMTRLTTMAAMPASTALAIGDVRMSVIGLDPDACS
jgi:hypothetical protein